MKVLAIACDYDRTLTDNNFVVSMRAIDALRKARNFGIKIILVSGRQLKFLCEVNKKFNDTFDCIVAENGAIVYLPAKAKKILLGSRNETLVRLLKTRNLPLDFGEVIIAVHMDYFTEVSSIVKKFKLNVVLEQNRDSLMILPAGVNKGVGVLKGVEKLGLDSNYLACIGDGENDLRLFEVARYKVAVANAVNKLKQHANYLCEKPNGECIVEFITKILDSATTIKNTN